MELVTSPSGMSEFSQLSRASRRTSQGSQQKLGVVEDGLQLFSIDGDKTHAICASAVGKSSCSTSVCVKHPAISGFQDQKGVLRLCLSHVIFGDSQPDCSSPHGFSVSP